jgi:hypothetical protein
MVARAIGDITAHKRLPATLTVILLKNVKTAANIKLQQM